MGMSKRGLIYFIKEIGRVALSALPLSYETIVSDARLLPAIEADEIVATDGGSHMAMVQEVFSRR